MLEIGAKNFLLAIEVRQLTMLDEFLERHWRIGGIDRRLSLGAGAEPIDQEV